MRADQSSSQGRCEVAQLLQTEMSRQLVFQRSLPCANRLASFSLLPARKFARRRLIFCGFFSQAKKLGKGGSQANLSSLSLDERAAAAEKNEEGHDSKDVTKYIRTVTGVLTSRPTSKDIKIDGFSMGINGVELIQDCSIELTIGRRHALLLAPPVIICPAHLRNTAPPRARISGSHDPFSPI